MTQPDDVQDESQEALGSILSFVKWAAAGVVVAAAAVFIGIKGASDQRPSEGAAVSAWASIDVGRRAVLARLKDPDSAQFRGERSGRLGVCGEVNSKNGFGGYAGYQRFIATAGYAVLEREMDSAEFARAWADAC